MTSTRMSEAEWRTRVDLAACYRLVDLFGWSDLINTRITARVPWQDELFLINPYGLLFDSFALHDREIAGCSCVNPQVFFMSRSTGIVNEVGGPSGP
jgi:hypothetical protein